MQPYHHVVPEGRPTIDVTAVDLGGDVALVVDREGTIVDVNDAFVHTTGYSRSEAIGQTPRLLGSGLQPPEVYRELWETVLAGQVWTGQLVDRHRDGRLRTYRVTISPISGADGRVTHLVAIQRDLASQRAQPLVASGIGELHTDRTGRCTFLDAEAARLLDADADTLYAGGWQRSLPADDVAAIHDSIQAMLDTGRPQRVDVRTATDRWLHLEISPLNDQRTGTIGSSWHLEDITNDVQTHARLARRDAVIAALLDAVADPIAVVQADGTVQAVNTAWSRGRREDHPLLGLGPGDDVRADLRASASDVEDRATEVLHVLERHLQGLPPGRQRAGLQVTPLANELGGMVIQLSSMTPPPG